MNFEQRLVRRWIAGEDIDDVLSEIRKENKKGISSIANFLGEDLTREKSVQQNISEYLKLMEKIKSENLDCSLSVKPSQLHMNRGLEHCREHFEEILKVAKENKIFVWVDMEDSRYTEDTIESYLRLHRKYGNIGIVVQADLKRSEKDLHEILNEGGVVRLVKGAYKENGKIAFQTREEINENFVKLMSVLFESRNYFAVATHDMNLIGVAIILSEKYHRDFEFQFLMGIQEKNKMRLLKNGYNVSNYVPYGKSWKEFISRRVKEKPSNILLILRDLVQ